jgi:glycosyltransferase involved in cell wall biosynthesis
MKIAVLSPVAWRTPPREYGPWEQVTSNIAEGLIENGIEVTLFATADSITRGKLESVCDQSYSEDPDVDPKVSECLHISNLMEQADKFDLIHNNFDFLPLTYSRLIRTPVVTTIHGFSSQKILPVYKKYNNTSYYVSISNSDRSPELDYMATVYNGVNTNDFTFCPVSDDYLLFFGRIHPEKGTYEAIQIAKQSGKIKPFVNNDDIVYVGNSGPKERDKLLGEACALLHPITFEEPFGLSVAESMVCGTPVIAFNRGSMPELILDGKTGFLINTINDAVEAVNNINSIDRKYCRDYAVSKFSRQKMVEGYLEVYKDVLNTHKYKSNR